ncbi:MAG: hypothetical protein JXL80_16955 [Planctomycetes bacterium]|nr:hypothetical protein [Planctomycetota bacterium]
MKVTRWTLVTAACLAMVAAGLPGCGDSSGKPAAKAPAGKVVGTDNVDDGQDEEFPLSLTHRMTSNNQIDPDKVPPVVSTDPSQFDFALSESGEAKYPVRFVTNRKAVFHCGQKQFAIPGTIWLDEHRAPDGDPRLIFRPSIDGSFRFSYADREPCTITDASGAPLKALKCSLELAGDGSGGNPLVTVYKLHLEP